APRSLAASGEEGEPRARRRQETGAEGRQDPQVPEERQPPPSGQEGHRPRQHAADRERHAQARPPPQHEPQEVGAAAVARPAASPPRRHASTAIAASLTTKKTL